MIRDPHSVAAEDRLVRLGRPHRGLHDVRTVVAGAWVLLCAAMILRLLLTATTPSISGFLYVALWSMAATPAALLVLAAWREHVHPTVVERVGDDLVITSPAFLTAPLVIPVQDVAEVRWGEAGPPRGGTKGWPALTSGPAPRLGLVLARPTALPAREPAPWTGEEMPRRHRPAHAVLLNAADPEGGAAALGRLVGLTPRHLPQP